MNGERQTGRQQPLPSRIIVTGGASGIGLATVALLLSARVKVGVIDADPQASTRLAELFPAETDKGSLGCVLADITDEDAVEKALDQLLKDGERPEGLVNSAGIARDIPFDETEAKLFRRILDVNVIGSFIVARAVARRMPEQAGGVIVNLASVSGIAGNMGRTAYGASKGAVVTMTKIMSVELAARNIRVNAVAPGPVDTPLVRDVHSPAARRAWIDRVPQRRYAHPDEIATVICFLLSKDASFVTGEVVAADGGFLAGGIMPRTLGGET